MHLTTRRSLQRRRVRKLVGLGISAAFAVTALPVALAPSAGASNEAKPRLYDPDMYWGADGYYTYASTIRGMDACGNTLWGGKYFVPVIKGSTSNLNGRCITGDAMPSGAGSWAKGDSDIWAPSISYFSGAYFLHYSAQKPSGQWCIGRASASSPLGPFTNQQEFACPGGGRWAIDPDAYVGPEGVFLTYRDDAIVGGNETGISSVKLGSNGHAIWSTRRDLLKSSDVGWAKSTRTNTNVIENPSLFTSEGRFYLMFSGNDYKGKKYAIGIADCGTTALPASRCKPLIDMNRPYYAYNGSGGHTGANGPVRTLPGNHAGPGGMASTTTYKGATTTAAVPWHWFAGPGDGDRYVKSGSMSLSGGYFNVS